MGTQTVTENEFNVLQFEKQLTSLKDSQDSINSCCQWCLQNRTHHKKIVNAWLNVLKRVKVEQRLILFYLANDVVQYSKRRNYEYVESWGTAIQKATTMVRDDRVKHKILRIFKIWEQRGVYNEEFISDLCGLLSVVPSGPKGDEPHEFQPNYVINKIKSCAKLEEDTDMKLKMLKEHNPKIQIEDGLIASLKDRAHLDDVEKEVDVYVKHMEDYINALKLEIKNRITLITVLKQAETQLEADRKDVKLVANAYKMFGTRVKTFQKKLDEHKATLSSPIPSPDVNAPSPSPDSDIELPEEETAAAASAKEVSVAPVDYNPKIELQYTNAGYYNPVPPPATDSSNSFLTNGFSSFIGSDISFNLENLDGSIFGNSTSTQKTVEVTQPASSYSTVSSPLVQNPPLPVEAPVVTSVESVQTTNYPSYNTGHLPLLPPPMPPFTKTDGDYGSSSYTTSYSNTDTTHFGTNYNTTEPPPGFQESFEAPLGSNPYPPSDEYNPEEDVSTWEPDANWNGLQDTDTPESPPIFEKEGYRDPVEYHDNLVQSGAVDVDQRVLPSIAGDLEDSLSSLGGKDVDHRNLISLTGSPGNSNSNNHVGENVWNNSDQDYRVHQPGDQSATDQDYRLSGFNIEQLKLPPPPPPPPKSHEENLSSFVALGPPNSEVEKALRPISKSPRRNDNVESIDMDLSDDDVEGRLQQKQATNIKIVVGNGSSREEPRFSLEPPPPLPDLPDDVDANNFLDDLSNDLHEFGNLSDELSNSNSGGQDSGIWGQPPLTSLSTINFNDIGGMVNPSRVNRSMNPPMNPMNPPMNPSMNPLNHSMNPMNSLHMNSMNPPPMNPINVNPPMNTSFPPPPSPLNNLMNPPPMLPVLPPPQPGSWMHKEETPWCTDEEANPWLNDTPDDENMNWAQQNPDMSHTPDWLPNQQRQNWSGPPNNANFGFRGRGNMRGNYNNNFNKPFRGRGRGNFVRGGINFRGARGVPRGMRGHWPRGNFRGNFRGAF